MDPDEIEYLDPAKIFWDSEAAKVLLCPSEDCVSIPPNVKNELFLFGENLRSGKEEITLADALDNYSTDDYQTGIDIFEAEELVEGVNYLREKRNPSPSLDILIY